MLVPMTKVAIVGHRRRLDDVAKLLQELSLVHVSDFTSAPELQIAPCVLEEGRSRELETLRLSRTRLDALEHLLAGETASTDDDEETRSPAVSLDELDTLLGALLPEVERAAQHIASLEQEGPALERHLESLQRLQPLASMLVELEGYETVALLLDRQHTEALDMIVSEIEVMVDRRCELTSAVVDRDTVGALLVFPRSHSDEVHALLGRGRVSRVRLPAQFEGLGFRDSLAGMEKRIGALPNEIAMLKDQLASKVRGLVDWQEARAQMGTRIEQLELVRQLGATEHTFTVVGWLPQRDIAKLETALEDRAAKEAHVWCLELHDDEWAPVLVANPPSRRPFERLVKLFGWPQPGGVDPTGLMSIFMPLFFGMMLGDIGYGVLLFGATWLARRRLASGTMLRDLARVLSVSAVWAVLWGILFGEIFGDLGERLFHLRPVWISRTEASAVKPLLLFAIAVGGVHVSLGLVLGAWSAARRRQHDKLAERLGQLAGIAALFTLAGVATEQLPRGLLTPSVIVLLVSMVVLGASHGTMGFLIGPLELIGTVGNVLSYLRLAAIGLASVYLARVANELAVMAPAVLGAIVAVLLHALNLALGTFSPTIQALRLHYVEFFSKFYDEGGTPYQPFGASASRQADG